MNKPDLLVCWIKHCDYPIFRRYLRRYRDFFGKIIIYWSEHFRDIYYDKFIQDDLSSLGNIQFLPNIEYEYGVEDWRNVATNHMLKFSDSEWWCSVEQDFFCKDWDKVLSAVTEASKIYNLLGYKGQSGQEWHQDYLTSDYAHPAFFFIKRELLEKTSKNFAAQPERGHDHFGVITREVMEMNEPIWYLQNNGFEEFKDCFHQGGINMNYLEGRGDKAFNFHRPELFLVYNYWSMKADVPQDPGFMEIMKQIDEKLRKQMPYIDPENHEFSIFYK